MNYKIFLFQNRYTLFYNGQRVNEVLVNTPTTDYLRRSGGEFSSLC